MNHLSKKQPHHLQRLLLLTAAGALLCFPRGLELSFPAFVPPSLACGALALSLAHLLIKLGPLPAPLRLFVLLPLAISPFILLLLMPGPLSVLFLLLPFALLLLHNAARLPPLPKPALFGAFYIILSLGAHILFQQAAHIPSVPPPRLPVHSSLWVSILVIIPLGLASRRILRPFAKAVFRYQLFTLLTLLALIPLGWTAATAFKVPREPALNFHTLRPQPRFFRLPSVGIDPFLSSDLRNHPHRILILRTLDEMTWRLSAVGMEQLISDETPLPPADMIRGMKLYGFLLEDRHGVFLPGKSFTRPAPPEMKEEYLPWFYQILDRIVLTPAELAEQLSLSPEEARRVLLDMRRMHLVVRVPGPDERFRLTPQARHPLHSGLHARQILLFSEPAAGMDPVEIETWTYARRWKLSYPEVRNELTKLVEVDAALSMRVWRWNQHASVLLNPALWTRTATWTLGFLLAWMAGRTLPLLRHPQARWITACMCSVWILPFPLSPLLMWNLRVGIGLWLLRQLIPDRRDVWNRAGLLAATLFFASLPTHTLSESTPLVHTAAWILLWTPAAILTLAAAVRPIAKDPQQVTGQ